MPPGLVGRGGLLAVVCVGIVIVAVFASVGIVFRKPSDSTTLVPEALYMVPVAQYEPVAGLYYVLLTISPSAGLTTDMFVLSITNNSTGTIPLGNSPASCTGPSDGSYARLEPATCGAPSVGWYSVLVLENATIASVFNSTGHWSSPVVPLTISMRLYLVAGGNQSGVGLLAAEPTGPQSVSGSAWV